jgi:plastocyanin
MNSKIAVAVGLAAVLAAILVPISAPKPAFAAAVAVSITSGASSKADNAFSPNPVNVKVGDTVTWTNKDSTPHTVTSGKDQTPDNKFDSSPGLKTIMAPQATFSHTFTEAGEYPYYCQLHPTMVGTVMVAAAGGGGGGGETVQGKVTAKTADGQSFDITSNSTTSKVTEAKINEGKSVTVTFDKAGDVQLTFPTKMVNGNLKLMAGGKEVQSTPTVNGDTTTLKFTLPAGTTSIDIMGTTVIPEFPVVAAAVLSASIAAIIGYTRFAKNGTSFFGRA